MRQIEKTQFQLGETNIAEIEFNLKSRDDIPRLLAGLQHIHVTDPIRLEVFAILDSMIPEQVNRDTGRPGMELWKILVLGVLRLNLNLMTETHFLSHFTLARCNR